MKRKVLIVTHSDLAEGLAATIDFFMPGMYEVKTICAFTKCNTVREELEAYFSAQNHEDEIVAFSDILFGSVNQWLGFYKNRPHYHLFTGTNAPLLLAVLLKPQDNYLTEEDIQNCITECSSSIIYVNSYQSSNASEDDE